MDYIFDFNTYIKNCCEHRTKEELMIGIQTLEKLKNSASGLEKSIIIGTISAMKEFIK